MTDRKYWLDLFTGKTWEEFLENGASVSGFRKRKRNTAKKIHPGDYLICYVTGIKRFIGVLEVKSDCYSDETPMWKDEIFPYRFKVKLIHKLEPATSVPIETLREKLSMFQNMKTPTSWTGFFRGSPTQFKQEDGEVIVEAIRSAVLNPTEVEFDERLYWRKPKTYESSIGIVTVPEKEEEVELVEKIPQESTHEEIQWLLLKLGSDIGLDVWVARNDRNKEFNGHSFQSIPNLRKELPRQFEEATTKIIELIDVLWLQGDAIVAAYEVEHTTAIYSGLLRLSDLVTMQPNININLYIVGPDERREKVFDELNRPTFSRLKTPLPKICRFIPYSQLKGKIESIGEDVKYMRPEFIDGIAEPCQTDDS